MVEAPAAPRMPINNQTQATAKSGECCSCNLRFVSGVMVLGLWELGGVGCCVWV
jgi:hypothetical protein